MFGAKENANATSQVRFVSGWRFFLRITDWPYFSGQQKGVMCLFGGGLCAVDNLYSEKTCK